MASLFAMKVDENELPERVRNIVKAQPLSPLSPNCRLREPGNKIGYICDSNGIERVNVVVKYVDLEANVDDRILAS